VILRTLFPFDIEYYVWSPNIHTIFVPYPDAMPGVYGKSRFITNSKGIRGGEFSYKHTYKILTIGGSTTECLYLDQPETWPHILEDILNSSLSNQKVWVGNVGKSGLNTRHHIIEMKYLLSQYQDIDTAIMMIGVNDLHARLNRDINYDSFFIDREHSEYFLINRVFDRYPENHHRRLHEKTAVWNLIERIRSSYYGFNEKLIQDNAGRVYIAWRKHRREAREIRDTLPDMSSALDEYRRNINFIIDEAQKRSIRIILVTQPVLWRDKLPKELDDLLWFGGIGNFQAESGKIYYSAGALHNGIILYNEVLLEVCRERAVEYIDLASLLF